MPKLPSYSVSCIVRAFEGKDTVAKVSLSFPNPMICSLVYQSPEWFWSLEKFYEVFRW
jgi:hypothetical protein